MRGKPCYVVTLADLEDRFIYVLTEAQWKRFENFNGDGQAAIVAINNKLKRGLPLFSTLTDLLQYLQKNGLQLVDDAWDVAY